MLDLRVPIAWFFGLIGLTLCIVWALPNAPTAPMAPADVNLKSGLVMLLFGAIMQWLARRNKS